MKIADPDVHPSGDHRPGGERRSGRPGCSAGTILGALPVCGGGWETAGDGHRPDIVLRCVAPEEDPARTAVETIMTRGCLTVGPEDAPQLAARRMAQGQVRRLPVVREGVLVGMVSLTDLVRRGAWRRSCPVP